jgi:predicted nucleic acid-binding protein
VILIDTNVLARSRQVGHIHYQAAVDAMVFERAQRQEVLVISPQTLVEFYATATRTLTNGLGLSPDQAMSEIETIQKDFPLFPESALIYPQWEMLVRKYKPTNRRVFDARHVAFMLVHRIPTILSFNDQDFIQYQEIQVLNPFDVLKIPRV